MPPSPRSPIDIERQFERKIARQLQAESTWLQRLLFALGKVEGVRVKLVETRQAPLPPIVVLDDGTSVPMGLVAQGVRRRIEEVMKALGQGDHGLPK